MKMLITILTIALLVQSCRVTKPVTTVFKDSIVTKETTVIKSDTTFLPGDTLEVWQAIPCPDAYIDTVVKKGHSSMQVTVKHGALYARCNTDSLQQIVDSVTTMFERYQSHQEVKEIPVEKRVPYIPKWVWYLVAYTIGSTLWKLRRPILSLFKIAV